MTNGMNLVENDAAETKGTVNNQVQAWIKKTHRLIFGVQTVASGGESSIIASISGTVIRI